MSAQPVATNHIPLRDRTIRLARRADVGERFLENGAVLGNASYCKLLEDMDTHEILLVAVHDPHHLTACESPDGKWLCPAFPEMLEVIETYPSFPENPDMVRGHIALDRAEWSTFMLHSGNLIKLPGGAPNLYYMNDFASYAALCVEGKDQPSEKRVYDIYGYFSTRGRLGRELPENAGLIKRYAHQITSAKFKGIYLGRATGELAAKKFIHSDFCLRFTRFLHRQNPLRVEEITGKMGGALMMLSHSMESIDVKKTFSPHTGFETSHILAAALLVEHWALGITFAQAIYELGHRLWHAKGSYMEAFLAHSHPSCKRKPFPVARATRCRILNAEEARFVPSA